jgi:hypothetical protein
LWYNDGTGLSQITRFDGGAEISFSWSPDGRAIAVVAHEALSLLRLGSELPQALELPFKVREIFQWREQELLLRAELDGALVLLSLSLESLQHRVLYSAQFSWAQWLDGQSLLLSDSGEVFRAVGETAETLLPEIKAGKVLGKFLIKDNNLMYLDGDKSVWRYDFNQKQSEKIASAQALKNIHDIEDFDVETGQLLYSGVPSARKEIVLFYND